MFFAPAVRTRAASPASALSTAASSASSTMPFPPTPLALNVEQDDKTWTLTLDVPGISREDLTIDIEGAVVRIESKADAKRQFKAAYELPQDIDVATSEAKLENGVLTLKLGKQVPVSNARRSKSSKLGPRSAAAGRCWRAFTTEELASQLRQRPPRLDVEGVALGRRCTPACRRIAAAIAIMAPLSVHRCSSG